MKAYPKIRSVIGVYGSAETIDTNAVDLKVFKYNAQMIGQHSNCHLEIKRYKWMDYAVDKL